MADLPKDRRSQVEAQLGDWGTLPPSMQRQIAEKLGEGGGGGEVRGYNMGRPVRQMVSPPFRNAAGTGPMGNYTGQGLRAHLAETTSNLRAGTGEGPQRPDPTTRDRLNAVSQGAFGTNVPTSHTGWGKAADAVERFGPQLVSGSRLAKRLLTGSPKADLMTRMEQRMSPEGLDQVYGRGGPVSQSPIRTNNYHIQGRSDRFAQQEHLVSSRYDPTLPERSQVVEPSLSPMRAERPVATPEYGAPDFVDMRGGGAANDFLHRQSTAGAGGNIWLGGDPQHSSMVSGIDMPGVRPIRRVVD